MKKDIEKTVNSIGCAEDIIEINENGVKPSYHLGKMIDNEPDSLNNLIDKLSDEERLRFIASIKNKDFTGGQKRMLKRVEEEKSKRRRSVISRIVISGIAAAVLFVSFSIFTDKSKNVEDILVAETVKTQTKVIKPSLISKDEIQLIIDEADVFNLEDIALSPLENDIVCSLEKEDKLSFDNNYVDSVKQIKAIVPARKTLQLELSDGTKITLNANTELSFPSNFIGEERRVKLSGEAFFEVEKDLEHPFIVEVDGVEHRVYGTKFNINSFNSDNLETVLVEGCIGVTSTNMEEVILKPNEVLNIDTKNAISTKLQVDDLSNYLSWLDNSFSYSGKPLSNVLKDINNWYGVEIIPAEEKDIRVTGIFSRDKELTEIIDMLENLTGVLMILKTN